MSVNCCIKCGDIMKILLAAGHGSGDSGAVGNGFKEADLARQVVGDIQPCLKDYADVTIFDMSKNMYQYLENGGKYDFSPFDYVLEVHFNAGGGQGSEILIHANQSNASVEQKILSEITKYGFRNRGIKKRSDLGNMNRLFKQGKDYALLEVCFIDSASDMAIYKNNTMNIAKAIASGIISGFGLTKEMNNMASSELTTVNDIVWELAEREIITNKPLWLKRLQQDINEYWLARKSVNYIGQHFRNDIKFDPNRDNGLVTPNDIIWELAERKIIENKQLWLTKLQEYGNAYWLARKIANYVRFL